MSMTKELYQQIESSYQKLLFGHELLLKFLTIAYLARGHILLEGPPGTGKTQTAKLISKLLAKNFKRVQFTSDLLPSDILGSHLYDPGKNQFEFVPGPIFSDFLLADEINRTPPRTQSALLEAMEEKQVTIDGKCYPLSEDFFVLATQNPQDYEGTFLLPEVQLDRFLFKIVLTHAPSATEKQILKKVISPTLASLEQNLLSISFNRTSIDEEIKMVHVEDVIADYVTQILLKTRTHPLLLSGASIRGGICLIKCARILALLEGRSYVVADDIKSLVIPALRHRVKLSSEAQMAEMNEVNVLESIVSQTPFPSEKA